MIDVLASESAKSTSGFLMNATKNGSISRLKLLFHKNFALSWLNRNSCGISSINKKAVSGTTE